MAREDPSNILLVCKDCSEKMYPNKGNFDIKIGDFVKIHFEREDAGEYMWVEVKKLNGKTFEGTLENDPFLIEDIKHGDIVTFTKDEVCERLRQ